MTIIILEIKGVKDEQKQVDSLHQAHRAESFSATSTDKPESGDAYRTLPGRAGHHVLFKYAAVISQSVVQTWYRHSWFQRMNPRDVYDPLTVSLVPPRG